MILRHEGKVAVVTGGARGIGQEYANRLAADGADVAVLDLQDSSDTAEKVTGHGRKAHTVTCDVTDPDQVAAAGLEVLDKLGRCDILVNNAGIIPLRPFALLDYEFWRKVMAVNLDAPFLTAKAFVPDMLERKWGRIINVTSNTIAMVIPGFAHYTASKAGIVGLTRGLASDLGFNGITANAIAPGLTRTDATAEMPAPIFDQVTQMTALKRLGEPEDLASVVSFLASEDAGYITGQTIVVDGGIVRL